MELSQQITIAQSLPMAHLAAVSGILSRVFAPDAKVTMYLLLSTLYLLATCTYSTRAQSFDDLILNAAAGDSDDTSHDEDIYDRNSILPYDSILDEYQPRLNPARHQQVSTL